MSSMTQVSASGPIRYPESDGEPLAENTRQYEVIVTTKGNLDIRFQADPNVFVAGDLLWYPVEGDNTISQAPDVLTAIGRPKGHRGSYRQWEEGGIAPQVVWEILSPGNRAGKMIEKFQFYERYGVEEYYVYDPDDGTLDGWVRREGRLQKISNMHGWVSPLLGVRFELVNGEMVLYHPDGRKFLTFLELQQHMEEERQRADLEKLAKEQAQHRADKERLAKEQAQQQAGKALQRIDRLSAQLRALGVEPENGIAPPPAEHSP